MAKITKLTDNTAAKTLDPEGVAPRLYKQVSVLLTQLERGSGITVRERTQALAAIARIQAIWAALRKANPDESERSGSTVRKYASAFSANAAGRRKANTGSEPNAEPDDWFESTTDDDDDSAA
jgi:hypothetical protein